MALKWMLVVIAVSASTAAAQAQQMTAAEFFNKHYRTGKTWKTITAYWVDGFIGGVMASSVHAEQDGKPIICVPDAVIGHEFVIQNMERAVKERPDRANTMWQFVAFTALREAFPCK
jgi:hypothetical protein